MTIKNGGPAFARAAGNNGATHFEDRDSSSEQEGMSLRDYFAGQVIAGMHARNTFDPGQVTPTQRAHLAYLDADALLNERAKSEGK